MSSNELKINKENYRIVRNNSENLLFHVPSTSLFELDEKNEELISKLSGNKINIDDFIDEGNEKLILEAIKASTTGKLKEVKESLPENITYLEIRAVYAKHFG
mgnify:CR=1 FL=1